MLCSLDKADIVYHLTYLLWVLLFKQIGLSKQWDPDYWGLALFAIPSVLSGIRAPDKILFSTKKCEIFSYSQVWIMLAPLAKILSGEKIWINNLPVYIHVWLSPSRLRCFTGYSQANLLRTVLAFPQDQAVSVFRSSIALSGVYL